MKKEGGKGKALARSALFFMIYSLFFSPAVAQTDVTNIYQIGGGTTEILDTYLSQEKFKGNGLTLLGTSIREEPGKNWVTVMQHEINYASADDRMETVNELQGDYTFMYGRYRTWQLSRRIKLRAGALGALNMGFIYNTSNSNNPAQGRMSLNVMPSAIASYSFPLWKRTWKVDYEVDLPFVGVMFSPNYGQSYYEIFSLGNYDNNIVATTPFTAPNLRQQLSIDCPVSKSLTLRVGYLGNYQQANVNNLKSHIYNHRVMIGIIQTLRVLKNKE